MISSDEASSIFKKWQGESTKLALYEASGPEGISVTVRVKEVIWASSIVVFMDDSLHVLIAKHFKPSGFFVAELFE